MASDVGKRAAGQAAADLVESGMTLGLGSGSTVAHFLTALAERRLDVAGLPTSVDTQRRCRELGIRLLAPADVLSVDLVVDGADELTHDLDLTKGGGGALLREKVVASMATRMVVIATPDKLVERLGHSFPLPIEVVPFAVPSVEHRLVELGFAVVRRGDGEYRTDNGNAILDARLAGGLADPTAMEARLACIPGVVENGLFVGLAQLALLGGDDGDILEVLRRA